MSALRYVAHAAAAADRGVVVTSTRSGGGKWSLGGRLTSIRGRAVS